MVVEAAIVAVFFAAYLGMMRGGGRANTATRPEEFNRLVLECLG
jgi:hypothetical protein